MAVSFMFHIAFMVVSETLELSVLRKVNKDSFSATKHNQIKIMLKSVNRFNIKF